MKPQSSILSHCKTMSFNGTIFNPLMRMRYHCRWRSGPSQKIGVTGGQWIFREFQRIRYIPPLGVPVQQVRISEYNHNGDQHLLGQQVEKVTKALDAVVNFSKEYAHEVNGAISKMRVALSTLRIQIRTMLKVCPMKEDVFKKMWTIIINKLINNLDHFNKTSWGLTLH